MTTSKRISVSDLDYMGIRDNLIEFLRGQDRFKDFNYEGSNMAILLDLLAFNTHYNALYTNMAVNELFLDSASKRSSVVSIARSLGYTPKSRTAARVEVSLVLGSVAGNPPLLTLPPYTTKFMAIKDGKVYTFVTTKEYSAVRNQNNEYIFEMEIFEGTPGKMRWVAADSTRFVIPSASVDSTSLRVVVNDSAAFQDYTNFVSADREMAIDGSTNVYFIRETFEGYTEVVFGDGVFGATLANGNIVSIDYLVTNGAEANNITTGFSSQNSLPGTIRSLTILSSDRGGSFGGAEREGVQEIRFNAPNLYASQGRAVTERDYEALITEKVPTIVQCAVWGGEKNVPPVYGKVFVCAKTVNNKPLTFAERDYIITDVIDPLKVVSVVTEFVDPTYIRVIPDIRVYWDPLQTASSEDEIRSYAVNAVEQYTANELERFNKVFRRSQLARLIEFSDNGIVSAVVRVKIGFDITPTFNYPTNYTVHTGNPWVPGTLTSEPFYVYSIVDANGDLRPLYFEDSNGVLKIYWVENGVKAYYSTDAGTVEYSTGSMTITSLNVYNATSADLRFTVTPSSDDVAGFNRSVVLIDKDNTVVTPVRDSSAMRDAGQFVFSASRV